MKRRSDTNRPHDPHVLYLDEGISGKALASLLKQARMPVHQYESLLPRNKKTPDSRVIEVCSRNGYVLVTTDRRMESEWIEDIVRHKAKVVLLTDEEGGPIHWASALIVSETSWRRILLDNPIGPIVIRISKGGTTTKFTGEDELHARRAQLQTARIVRSKKHGL